MKMDIIEIIHPVIELAQESKHIIEVASFKKNSILKGLIFANLRDHMNTLVGPLSRTLKAIYKSRGSGA